MATGASRAGTATQQWTALVTNSRVQTRAQRQAAKMAVASSSNSDSDEEAAKPPPPCYDLTVQVGLVILRAAPVHHRNGRLAAQLKDLATLRNGGVYVAVSDIPNAGRGVFAGVAFDAGQWIVMFGGHLRAAEVRTPRGAMRARLAVAMCSMATLWRTPTRCRMPSSRRLSVPSPPASGPNSFQAQA